VIIGSLLLIVFVGLYFTFSLYGRMNKQLRDLDDHKQRCFDAIGRPRRTAERQSEPSISAPASPASSPLPTGVLKRFSIR